MIATTADEFTGSFLNQDSSINVDAYSAISDYNNVINSKYTSQKPLFTPSLR
jgi:hypothetical protein